LSTNPTNRATNDVAPKRSPTYLIATPISGRTGFRTMHPFRAFMLSFVLGSAALFGGYGVIAEMAPVRVNHTITV
jgi:hypothetical protein